MAHDFQGDQMHAPHVFIRDVLPGHCRPTADRPTAGRTLPSAVLALATGAALPLAVALQGQIEALRTAAALHPDTVVGAAVLTTGLLVTLWYAATSAGLLVSTVLRRELAVERWGAPYVRRLALGAGLGLLTLTPAHADVPDDLSWGAATLPAITPVAEPTEPPAPTAPVPADRVPGPAPAREDGPATHVVVAGECLWMIAAAELPSPTNRSVAERVDEWIGANPDLAANPDLIHPGDVLAVPDGAGR